jgi:hypothetical protein
MVEVEIRTPLHDEEAQSIEWKHLAFVRADSDGVKVYGDAACVPDDSVISPNTGKRVDCSAHPEEWTRSLPDAYRSGDIVAVILHDDSAPESEQREDVEEPSIPEPPALEHDGASDRVAAAG